MNKNSQLDLFTYTEWNKNLNGGPKEVTFQKNKQKKGPRADGREKSRSASEIFLFFKPEQ